MKYICDICGTHLAYENQELPSQCPKCSNGSYGEKLDTRQLYTINELLDKGRINPSQVSVCGICGRKNIARNMETVQKVDVCSGHISELYDSNNPVKMFETELDTESESKIADRFIKF